MDLQTSTALSIKWCFIPSAAWGTYCGLHSVTWVTSSAYVEGLFVIRKESLIMGMFVNNLSNVELSSLSL